MVPECHSISPNDGTTLFSRSLCSWTSQYVCMNYILWRLHFLQVHNEWMNDHHSPKKVGSPFLPICLTLVFFWNSSFDRLTSSSPFSRSFSCSSSLITSGNSKVSPLKFELHHLYVEVFCYVMTKPQNCRIWNRNLFWFLHWVALFYRFPLTVQCNYAGPTKKEQKWLSRWENRWSSITNCTQTQVFKLWKISLTTPKGLQSERSKWSNSSNELPCAV